jgi:tetratricopeptide (TPR) repeat protein
MSRSKVRNILLLKQIHSAVAQIRKGNLDKALETLDKAEDSAKKAKATDALYYILFMRGGIYYTESKYNEALETYEKAIDAGSELLKNDPENTNYRHYMGTTLSNTGNLLKNKGEKPQAAEYYIRARETYVNLLAKEPENAVFRSTAGENLNNYAALLTDMGSFEEACEILNQAIELYEKLLEEKPENPGYQAEFAVALSQLGNCQIQQSPEKSDTAKQNLEKALAMQEKIFAQQSENAAIKDAIALTRKRLEKLENLEEQENPESLEKPENRENLEKQEIPKEQKK